MKILVTIELEARHLDQLKSAGDDIDVVVAATKEEAMDLIPDADVLVGGFSLDLYRRAERLRWVQSWGAGVDGVLFKEFVDSDIRLTSAKGTVGVHLAEHAMALLFGLTRGIGKAVREGVWHNRMPIRKASWELIDRTMGIVGLGGTGQALAARASAFGTRILAIDPEDVDLPERVESCWKLDRFHEMLRASDIVAICAPLTEETEGMFDDAAFDAMQNHALLINVTRGRIMNEDALVSALKDGKIGGAGLDVTPQEPLPEDHDLWTLPNVIITPHTAGGSPNRDDRLLDLITANIDRFKSGEPLLSEIDKKKGY
jgi:phosphoglycerate dehydrogenase-like enzyme